MRLIFIRHAEPDYEKDSLTEKGFREAAYLAERAAAWPVDEVHVSPLGRAQDTARPTLERLGLRAETHPWLKEFFSLIRHPVTGRPSIPWDFLPGDWTREPELLDPLHWMDAPRYDHGIPFEAIPKGTMAADSTAELPYGGNLVRPQAEEVIQGFDALLARHGYRRDGLLYRVDRSSGATLVFFAHLGVIDVILSHLLLVSPLVLWQGMFLPPSSVTVVQAEEREPGIAAFRVQSYGDTAHLLAHGEPVSASGYFTETFSL